MFSPLKRRLVAGAVAVGLALSLAACSTSSNSSSDASASTGSSSGTDANAFPVTIKSTLGSATIESAPKRVVTIGWGSADTVVALGTVPVGIEKVTYGNDAHGDYPWVTSAIQKAGGTLPATFNVYPDIDVSAIAALNPDVIIAPQSGLTQAQYNTLSALAPTVAYPGQAWLTKWDTQIDMIGKALGKEKQAKQQVTAIKAKLAAAAKANPEFSKLTFAYISAANAGTLSLYAKGDPRVDLLSSLGLTETKEVAAVPLAKNSYLATLGLEKANTLDSTDILVTWFYDDANEKATLSQPLIASLPAVKRDSIVSTTDQQFVMGSTFITPLSVPYALDRYIPMLKKAAAKVG
ncbi:iron-siderophore ABC transporter substrate-binding protein [Frondihabitans cladoniiphilus]|uniref:Iron-siderophore ABC transporter substrate-binding protein n=1 Tax=Frondihabitans cladoniiphilus TaxID=715785 RepID=A0ABP8VKT6_9MICO